jgi:hypothetical protein
MDERLKDHNLWMKKSVEPVYDRIRYLQWLRCSGMVGNGSLLFDRTCCMI